MKEFLEITPPRILVLFFATQMLCFIGIAVSIANLGALGWILLGLAVTTLLAMLIEIRRYA